MFKQTHRKRRNWQKHKLNKSRFCRSCENKKGLWVSIYVGDYSRNVQKKVVRKEIVKKWLEY